METFALFLQQNNLTNKTVAEQKHFLRKYLIQNRKKEFESFSNKNEWGKEQFFKSLAKLNVSSQNEFESKYRIACFFPIRAELNFLPYAKPHWLFPKILNKNLFWFEYGDGISDYTLNQLKIPEKFEKHCFEYKPEQKPLVCFVPGLAGDLQKYRIGYGRGYYDNFLAKHPDIISILCLPSKQFLFDKLPKETHDMPMTHIII